MDIPSTLIASRGATKHAVKFKPPTVGCCLARIEVYEIRKAAQAMVSLAAKFQPQMVATKTFPLPNSGQTIFYVLTDAGVFTASAPENDLGEQRHMLSPLFYAGQEVITQYRLFEMHK
jgi:hypothetical protein